MRDLLNNSEQIMLLSAKRRITCENGTAVDLRGEGRKLMVVASVGATSTVTAAITIQESADNATWTTIAGGALITGNVEAQVVDLTPTMRYIRAIVTMASTEATGTYIDFGLTGIFYNLRYIPENIA